ncbi:hypothetical protein CLAFUW4_08579 [Fulvia fulva]|uniref:2,6-dihydroxypyridine 3-monooxygenase substrate binding domain-containing protein n=1 Tax=Passalora fulva TaxID=5499 RepID=A0A9Q8LC69_PASFU|nr:uncharacterized protein CLAFUR5_08681 [Fulvia fulva]KAK4629535.1 hypothetical protein CLAFUR4_08582 [Fulvia fulva]KAK4630048.1 hypothetical protein CLAFUR0_08577 [Fulvia fulva]UJO14811.1 hypothetical protein CLAFUR5_08681 [Fulvia fulva]WPV12961.1 hypothetical protein CLAFUW4_08579 [Fulvia fulva]WPV27949.1 hypothetical protein CLAFUW7_08577 [Fulvia fulva]
MTSWGFVLLPTASQPILEGGKLPEERLTDGTYNYRHGCTVTSITDEGSRVRVKFTRKQDNGVEIPDELTTTLVIAADGPSSTTRTMLHSEVQRTYAGYVVIRGTVPETHASQSALSVFRARFCFSHSPGIQNLTYTIAGENGSTEPGKRLLNFVWYANFPEGSEELEKLITDKDGRRRHIIIPRGKIAWDAWEMLKSKADERLPPQMAEMAHKTTTPFVQCTTDVIAPKNLYMNDKVALFERLSVREYIEDRNMMSVPHKEMVFPEWTREGLDGIQSG